MRDASSRQELTWLRKFVAEKLAELGYSKHKSGVFTLPLAPGIVGWLAMGMRGSLGELVTTPNVGVRFEAVHHLVDECLGLSTERHLIPTVSRPLGYLMREPRYRTWTFTRHNAEVTAAYLVGELRGCAVEYMRSVDSLERLLHMLDSGAHAGQMERYLIPAALVLNGQGSLAATWLDRYADRISTEAPPLPATFQAFAARLRPHCSVHPVG